jgi:hypothetical protein
MMALIQMQPAFIPVGETPRVTFRDRALAVTKYGIPVIWVLPELKKTTLAGWPNLATTDLKQIELWNEEDPTRNVGCVAKAVIGGIWFLDIDKKETLDRIKSETGQNIPPTWMSRSQPGRGHFGFNQTAASIAMGNIDEDVTGGFFSCRVNNEYIVGPLSYRRDLDRRYEYVQDVAPVDCPQWLIDWCKAQVKDPKTKTAQPTGGLIPHRQIHPAMVSYAGKLREVLGLDLEKIEPLLLEWVHEHCEPPIDDDKVRACARSICNYDKGDTASRIVISSANSADEVLAVEGDAQILDMPPNVIPDCVLGTIARDYMSHIPLAYSLPALLTVGGTMVPPPERTINESIAISQGAGSQTNLYTALIGPINSGKSQAIVHAVGNLGLHPSRYDITKNGSAEGLFKKLARLVGDISETSQRLVNLDEWSFFFKKAGIENSSFVENLNSAFNTPEIRLTIAKGEEISVNVALSLIGGIVTDGVQSCFGAESTTGFYDRFLFGVNPTLNVGEYIPFDFSQSAQDSMFDKPEEPVRVKIDRSVWDLVNQWKKADHTLGRALEITVRCCAIVASFDGRTQITAKDLETMRPFVDYQMMCRQIVQPTAGITLDAKMANSILGWLKRHADGGQWVNQRDMKKGIHKVLDELGPGAFKNAMSSLGMVRAIQTQVRKNEGARDSYLVRLAKGE